MDNIKQRRIDILHLYVSNKWFTMTLWTQLEESISMMISEYWGWNEQNKTNQKQEANKERFLELFSSGNILYHTQQIECDIGTYIA